MKSRSWYLIRVLSYKINCASCCMHIKCNAMLPKCKLAGRLVAAEPRTGYGLSLTVYCGITNMLWYYIILYYTLLLPILNLYPSELISLLHMKMASPIWDLFRYTYLEFYIIWIKGAYHKLSYGTFIFWDFIIRKICIFWISQQGRRQTFRGGINCFTMTCQCFFMKNSINDLTWMMVG